MRNNFIYLLFVSLTFLHFSCGDEQVVYEEKIEMNEAGFSWSDSLVFTPVIPDTTQRYNLYLALEHEQDFNYQNVYLDIHTHYPDVRGSKGLASIQLQGDDGRWSGSCGGNNCVQEVVLKDNIRFKKEGKYNIVIHQASRDAMLKGVKSIKLSLEVN